MTGTRHPLATFIVATQFLLWLVFAYSLFTGIGGDYMRGFYGIPAAAVAVLLNFYLVFKSGLHERYRVIAVVNYGVFLLGCGVFCLT